MPGPDRLPIVGADNGTWGQILNGLLTDMMPWTIPEAWGLSTGGATGDTAAIQAAISGLQATGNAGLLVIGRRYQIDPPGIIVAGAPAVHFLFTSGTINRQSTPAGFNGCSRFIPAPTFPANTPLLTLGTAGNPGSNPNGTLLFNPAMSGFQSNNTAVTGITGLQLFDTSDITLMKPNFANFDPTGATGICIAATGSVGNGCVGLNLHGGDLLQSWRGVKQDGVGANDLRVFGTYLKSVLKAFGCGESGSGGGGTILNGIHATFAGAGAGGFIYLNGAGANDFNICQNYFDTYGNNAVLQFATSHGICSNNHFIADATLAGPVVSVSDATIRMQFI